LLSLGLSALSEELVDGVAQYGCLIRQTCLAIAIDNQS